MGIIEQIDAVVHPVIYENPIEDCGLPYVTKEGILKLGDAELRVMVLSNGKRIVDKCDLDRLFSSPEEQEAKDVGDK